MGIHPVKLKAVQRRGVKPGLTVAQGDAAAPAGMFALEVLAFEIWVQSLLRVNKIATLLVEKKCSHALKFGEE